MYQNAIVKELVSSGVVRISLMRQLECGGGCKSCNICTAKPTKEIFALASDQVGTRPGDWVEVESNTGSAIWIAVLVYLLPCTGLLAGYLAGQLCGLGEGQSILAGAAALVLSFLPARMLDRAVRRRGTPEFTVLRLKHS